MAKIPIIFEPGRADGKLANSNAIFDENKGMFQSEINDIQDTLNSDNPNKPLSAKQGKVLKELLDTKVIEAGGVPIDTEPTEGNTANVVTSDGIYKALAKKVNNITFEEKVAELDYDIESLNTNSGISEYPLFDEAKAYAAGEVVLYEGLLKRFISAHEPGAWDASQVKAWSERKEVDRKMGELESAEQWIRTDLTHLEFRVPKIGESKKQLSLCDENGNVIMSINNGFEVTEEGHILIKGGFDSKKIESNIESASTLQNDVNNIFSIVDSNGNVIAKINGGIEIDKEGIINTKSFSSSRRSQFPKIDYNKKTFRWLDIGNSHSNCALFYLRSIALSQEVDLENVAFCTVSRGGSSFDSWYKGYYNRDDESGDNLTGNKYMMSKHFGNLDVSIKGTRYNAVTGTTESVDKNLDRNSMVFYGKDTSLLKSLLKDNEWDLITIHQRYAFNDKYNDSEGWTQDLEESEQIDGIGNSGCADKFIRIIKTLCPSATVGYLFALVPFGYDGTSYNPQYNSESLANTVESHNRWCNTMRKFMSDSGVEFIIPCDTALQNLRISDVPNIDGENVLSRFGFNYDAVHTAYGVAAYTMAAVAWEMVFAPRFNKSIYGNTLVELESDDVHTSTQMYLQPSYTNSDGVKIKVDESDGAWNKPSIVGYTSNDGGDTWVQSDRVKATVRLSATNNILCQIAALSAVNDFWHVINPNNVELI